MKTLFIQALRRVQRAGVLMGKLGMASIVVSLWISLGWVGGGEEKLRGLLTIAAIIILIAVEMKGRYRYVGIVEGLLWLAVLGPMFVSIIDVYMGMGQDIYLEGGVIISNMDYMAPPKGGWAIGGGQGQIGSEMGVDEEIIIPEREIARIAQEVRAQQTILTLADISMEEVCALEAMLEAIKPEAQEPTTSSNGDGHLGLYTTQAYEIRQETNNALIELNRLWEALLVERSREVGGQEYPNESKRYWRQGSGEIAESHYTQVPYDLRADCNIVWMTEKEAGRIREWAGGQEDAEFIQSVVEGLEIKIKSSETGAFQAMRDALGEMGGGEGGEAEKDLAMVEGYHNMRNLGWATVQILKEELLKGGAAGIDESLDTSRGAMSLDESLDTSRGAISLDDDMVEEEMRAPPSAANPSARPSVADGKEGENACSIRGSAKKRRFESFQVLMIRQEQRKRQEKSRGGVVKAIGGIGLIAVGVGVWAAVPLLDGGVGDRVRGALWLGALVLILIIEVRAGYRHYSIVEGMMWLGLLVPMLLGLLGEPVLLGSVGEWQHQGEPTNWKEGVKNLSVAWKDGEKRMNEELETGEIASGESGTGAIASGGVASGESGTDVTELFQEMINIGPQNPEKEDAEWEYWSPQEIDAILGPEPVVPEPVIPEPVIPEPVIPEPVIPEPVVPEPVIPEPVVPEPVRLGDQPQPARAEPVVLEPARLGNQQPAYPGYQPQPARAEEWEDYTESNQYPEEEGDIVVGPQGVEEELNVSTEIEEGRQPCKYSPSEKLVTKRRSEREKMSVA